MFCRRGDFMAIVAHALVHAASTLVATPGGISRWSRLCCSVGRTPSSARDPLVALLLANRIAPRRADDRLITAGRHRGPRHRRSCGRRHHQSCASRRRCYNCVMRHRRHSCARRCSVPSTVALNPSTVAPEPSTVAPEPSTVAPEPNTVAPEPSTVAPNPSTVAPEPGCAARPGSVATVPRSPAPRSAVPRCERPAFPPIG